MNQGLEVYRQSSTEPKALHSYLRIQQFGLSYNVHARKSKYLYPPFLSINKTNSTTVQGKRFWE